MIHTRLSRAKAAGETYWTANTTYCVVGFGKGNLHPVPVGVVGELYIGGVQIARGYLNGSRPDRRAFCERAPVASQPEARIYRTGELADGSEDGNIEYLGRKDYQVKIRGFRVELGEIETRLSEHPLLREAVVVAREDGGGETVWWLMWLWLSRRWRKKG